VSASDAEPAEVGAPHPDVGASHPEDGLAIHGPADAPRVDQPSVALAAVDAALPGEHGDPGLAAWRDSEQLVLPLPPAPPGERGYRPGDVERLVQVLAALLADPESAGPDELASLKLSRTFFVGQGYHVEAVDAVRQAWVDELRRRAR